MKTPAAGHVRRLLTEALGVVDAAAIGGDTCIESRNTRWHMAQGLEHLDALDRRRQSEDGEGNDD